MEVKLPRRVPIEVRWLILGLMATTVAFLPGLGGDFAFDDYPNIVENAALSASDVSANTLAEVVFSSESGPSRRPLASLSFLANRLFFGPGAFSYKLTNLAIHLINVGLIFALVRVLQRSASARLTGSPLLPGAAALLWAVHPIQLTSVLYVVQRMNSLSALFVLLAMLLWTVGRQRAITSGRPMAIRWWVGCLLSGFLGVLSKENAILLPLYIGLLEFAVFRFEGMAWARAPALIGLVLLPIAAVGYIVVADVFAEGYLDRGFTARQRLLTELRVLCYYLQQLFLPIPHEMALLHEDWTISRGLFEPVSTLSALFFWGVFVVFALWQSRRRPWLCLGLLWFLVGHLLESTVIPLDLVYDHRNYLPSVGLCLVTAQVLISGLRMQSRSLFLLLGGCIVVLSAMTAYRAWQWHDELTLALLEARHNPASSRARYELGRVKYNLFLKGLDAEGFEAGLTEMEAAVDAGDEDFLPLTAMISMYLIAKKELPENLMVRMESELAEKRPSGRRTDAVAILIQCQLRKNACPLAPEPILRSAGALLANPEATLEVKSETLEWLTVYYANALQDFTAASSTIAGALEFSPESPGLRLRQAELFLAVGRPDLTSELLDGVASEMSSWSRIRHPQLAARLHGLQEKLASVQSE